MYRERMIGYYPQVIQSILEFQAIVDAEYPEMEDVAEAQEQIVADAYLTTMGEERIAQWEMMLGITPIEGSSVEDRRETIIARMRGQGKLNTALINKIVNTFTGGTARSWVKNSILYVEVTPPPDNKSYQFANVEQELKNKVPAHLGIKVSRNYYTWEEMIQTTSSKTISGVVISIKDASAVEQELDVTVDVSGATVTKYGKNLLPYPYASESQTINGVTFTINDDGSITVNGTTTTTNTSFFLNRNDGKIPLKDGVTYAASQPPNVYLTMFTLVDGVYNKEKFTWESTNSSLQVFLYIPSAGITFDNVVFYPQIEVGETNTDYEPYVEPTTYTADENGVVKGITAQGENMTLFADNGANITCTYNNASSTSVTWQSILDDFNTWNDVVLYVPFE